MGTVNSEGPKEEWDVNISAFLGAGLRRLDLCERP